MTIQAINFSDSKAAAARAEATLSALTEAVPERVAARAAAEADVVRQARQPRFAEDVSCTGAAVVALCARALAGNGDPRTASFDWKGASLCAQDLSGETREIIASLALAPGWGEALAQAVAAEAEERRWARLWGLISTFAEDVRGATWTRTGEGADALVFASAEARAEFRDDMAHEASKAGVADLAVLAMPA